jgi:hypothetical protein
MKRVIPVATMPLALALVGARAGAAQSPPASSTTPPWTVAMDMPRAVDLVLASDPSFAGLQSRQHARTEIRDSRSSWYDVRETLTGSYLVEITLAEGDYDVTLPGRTWPCAWRHRYPYRVTPDWRVALRYDEGDPPRTTPRITEPGRVGGAQLMLRGARWPRPRTPGIQAPWAVRLPSTHISLSSLHSGMGARPHSAGSARRGPR